MSKTKITVAIILIVLLGVALAYAFVTWEGSITWTLETKEFSVWTDATGGTLLPTYSENLGLVLSGDEIFNFYLQNAGTVEITIQVTEISLIGATALWSDSGSWIIPVGATRIQATLTLTITASGNYDWEFTIA